MNGIEECEKRLEQMKMLVHENPCNMSPFAFAALAQAMDSLLKGFFSNSISEEKIEFRFKNKTERRADEVRAMYELLKAQLGDKEMYIARSYYYDKISEITGLSARRIQEILNS